MVTSAPFNLAASRQQIRAGAAIRQSVSAASYPPLRDGFRGTHEGASHVAHQMALQGRMDWGVPVDTGEDEYDLIVVGGGASGLAAARFYQRVNPGARILILENHDDFGGHARRNEFELDGRMYLGMGGSEGIAPLPSSAVSELFEDLQFEPDEIADTTDHGIFERHGLGHVFHFDRETYGVNRNIAGHIPQLLQLPIPESPTKADIDAMPMSGKARQQLWALYSMNEDRTEPGVFSEFGYLNSITYEQFLTRHGGISDPEVLDWLRQSTIVTGMHADTVPAITALGMGWPGIGGTSFRFMRGKRIGKLAKFFLPEGAFCPDGNATVPRMLVRKLIPAVSNGGTSMSSVITAPFDYSQLDNEDSPVRLRLNSTVVKVCHDGSTNTAERVFVTYIRNGQTERVPARHTILACWNSVIPYIWDEIPAIQSEALRKGIKLPMAVTNVLLRNWRAFEKAGIGGFYAPGYLHSTGNFASESGLGDGYGTPASADEPAVYFLRSCPKGFGEPDLRNRARTGRSEMMTQSFDDYEKDLRRLFTNMLGEHGFEFDRDVAAITVNRWPHGYASGQSPVFDPEYPDGEAPHEVGRRGLGRIAIANSDAEAEPLIHGAINQAKRAVDELIG